MEGGTSDPNNLLKKPTRKRKKYYKCRYNGCDAAFYKNSKLVTHIRIHTGERPYVCDFEDCYSSFITPTNLRRHKGSHTEDRRFMLPCKFSGCDRKFSGEIALDRHCARFHDPSRKYKFKCGECDAGFQRKTLLLRHIQKHTGEFSFECSGCPRLFETYKEMTRHERTHTAYLCECGEEFERWLVLLAHKKEAHKKEPVCDICEKRFFSLNNLREHKKVHQPRETAPKYICYYTDCGRVYLYKKNLVGHLKRKHGEIISSRQLKSDLDD